MLLRCPNPSEKRGEHSFQLDCLALKGLELSRLEKSKVAGEEQMILEFTRRACRDLQEPSQVSAATPSAALGNIGGDRGARSPDLTGQAVQLSRGEFGCCPVDGQSQLMAPLPDLQFLKVLHVAPPAYPKLITDD